MYNSNADLIQGSRISNKGQCMLRESLHVKHYVKLMGSCRTGTPSGEYSKLERKALPRMLPFLRSLISEDD